MKRRVLQLIVLLLLGAIVNVAVAWGCACNPRSVVGITPVHGAFPLPEPSIYMWDMMKFEGIGTTWVTSFVTLRQDGMADGLAVCPYWSHYPTILYDDRIEAKTVIAHGWPLRSLHLRLGVQTGTQDVIIESAFVAGRADEIHLPYAPIWPGFAINTIFYAAILGVVFFVPGMVKRRLRRMRGLCPACAYPVGTWGAKSAPNAVRRSLRSKPDPIPLEPWAAVIALSQRVCRRQICRPRNRFAAPGMDLTPPEWIWRASPRFGAPRAGTARPVRIWRPRNRFGAPTSGLARP